MDIAVEISELHETHHVALAGGLCTAVQERQIAQVLAHRDRTRLTPEEEHECEAALRRAILTLWQTSILRRNRLKVIDEVNNGLSYYDYTFFKELPRVYNGLGISILSTPRGVMSDHEARAANVGGEVLCRVF